MTTDHGIRRIRRAATSRRRQGSLCVRQRLGDIETALTVLGVRVSYLTPPVWKRLNGIPPGAGMKDVARSAAVRRWPAKANLFARVKDDGRAEAALIGVAGLKREKDR